MSGLYIELHDAALDALADRIADRLAARLAPAPAPPVAYSPATLAAELGCTPRAIRAAIERGELAAVRRGRGYVIAAAAVEAWASAPARRGRRRTPAAQRTMRDALDV